MLDAYSSIGMPLMYRHWSFGKHFVHEEHLYRKGRRGLAYELVINSNPCIVYLMEENTMAMQALVTAHAAFGHNHFFKNNYLFQQWTDAGAILNYMEFAKSYIQRCEEKHGLAAVEAVLDAAHALMDQGVFRYRRPPRLSTLKRSASAPASGWNTRSSPSATCGEPYPPARTAGPRRRRRSEVLGAQEGAEAAGGEPALFPGEEQPGSGAVAARDPAHRPRRRAVLLSAAADQGDERRLRDLRPLHDHEHAVRPAAGSAKAPCWRCWHSHSNVVFQPGFDDPRYSGHQPLCAGFRPDAGHSAHLPPIRRPKTGTGFPSIAGNGDWLGTLLDAWANHRDESFVLQYLSPALIRKMRLFVLGDEANESYYQVASIHDERGYETHPRRRSPTTWTSAPTSPTSRWWTSTFSATGMLRLQHTVHDGVLLSEPTRDATLQPCPPPLGL